MKKQIKDSKNIVIIALAIAILFMSVGYAAFTQELIINGTAKITGDWNIEITDVTAETGGLAISGSTEWDKVSVKVFPELKQPGDYVTYTIKVENNGNIDAQLEGTSFITADSSATQSPAIKYTWTTPAETLLVGDETTFTLTATYDPEYTTIPDITTKSILGTVTYVQKDS